MANPVPLRTLLLALVIVSSAYMHAAEHPVPCASVPAVVQEKAKSMLDGGAIRRCIKDVSKGKTTYEMETVKHGRSKDMTFDPRGNMLEVEEQVDLASLPPQVAAAMQKAAGGGQLGSIESLQRKGVLISYEAVVTDGGKRREVAFRPDGSPMKAD